MDVVFVWVCKIKHWVYKAVNAMNREDLVINTRSQHIVIAVSYVKVVGDGQIAIGTFGRLVRNTNGIRRTMGYAVKPVD